LGWKWVGQLKANRLISVRQGEFIAASNLDWTDRLVRKVWLKEYRFILVNKMVATNGDIAYIATNDVSLEKETLKAHFDYLWTIEAYYPGIKQCTGIELCSATNIQLSFHV
jgi:hypothetical protein